MPARPFRVKVLLVCAAERFASTSDSGGRYTIAAPEGSCSVLADASSIPVGYTMSEARAQPVSLESRVPVRADYELRAMRSLTGVVAATAPGAAVTLGHGSVSLVKKADAAGRFASGISALARTRWLSRQELPRSSSASRFPPARE